MNNKDRDNWRKYRNFYDYLNQNKIVYCSFPSVEDGSYIRFEEPVYGIDFFRYKFKKITSTRHLVGITASLIFYSSEINWNYDSILQLLYVLGRQSWGASGVDFSDGKLQSIAVDLEYKYQNSDLSPMLVSKKIRFGSGYTKSKILEIIRKEFGTNKKVYTKEKIKAAIEFLIESHDDVITYSDIAEYLDCAEITIKKNIDIECKTLMSEHNEGVRYDIKFQKVRDAMLQLIESNDASVCVRNIKKLTYIKDYKLINDVLSSFEY